MTQVLISPALIDLIPTYLQRRKEEITILQDLIKIQDFNSMMRIGHKLQGSGSTYGLHEISKIGKNIELAAKNKDTSQLINDTQSLLDYISTIEICAQGKYEI